jgi:hypothetical protein
VIAFGKAWQKVCTTDRLDYLIMLNQMRDQYRFIFDHVMPCIYGLELINNQLVFVSNRPLVHPTIGYGSEPRVLKHDCRWIMKNGGNDLGCAPLSSTYLWHTARGGYEQRADDGALIGPVKRIPVMEWGYGRRVCNHLSCMLMRQHIHTTAMPEMKTTWHGTAVTTNWEWCPERSARRVQVGDVVRCDIPGYPNAKAEVIDCAGREITSRGRTVGQHIVRMDVRPFLIKDTEVHEVLNTGSRTSLHGWKDRRWMEHGRRWTEGGRKVRKGHKRHKVDDLLFRHGAYTHCGVARYNGPNFFANES